MSTDHDGNLWLGTWNGLWRFHEGRFSSYTRRNGLPHDHLEALCEDGEGSLWVGTRGGGLARIHDGKFTHFTTNDGLAHDFAKFWNETGASFAFSLAPHFYQTVWFYAVCAVASGVAAWSFHLVRLRQARDEFALVLGERNRIARDLHDTLAQGFAGIGFQLEAVAAKLQQSPAQAQQHLEVALNMVRHSLSEARRTVMNLRSAALEQGDILKALGETAREAIGAKPVTVDLERVGPAAPLPPALEENLLRVGQEAITNALQHSGGTRIQVRLCYSPRSVCLRILDNGTGFDPAQSGPSRGAHFGLLGMRERAKQVAGTLNIRSNRQSGTEISFEAPILAASSLP